MLNVLGNLKHLYVRQANKMVSRSTLILWLQVALGILILVEQPAGSLMEMHFRLKEWIARCNIFRISINMDEFGGGSKKPVWIYSPA